MNHLRYFKLFESSINKPILKIEEFLQKIGLPNNETISNWWKLNRPNIKIYFFEFTSTQPIAGVFLGENEIAINQKMMMPPHIKLFLALHESRHCDQHKQGIINPKYYETVVNQNMDEFLTNYQELEKDANDFAINAMREMGFENQMRQEEMRLRGNEGAGPMVYRMMTSDIKKYNSTDFVDLLKKQIM